MSLPSSKILGLIVLFAIDCSHKGTICLEKIRIDIDQQMEAIVACDLSTIVRPRLCEIRKPMEKLLERRRIFPRNRLGPRYYIETIVRKVVVFDGHGLYVTAGRRD